MEKITLSKDELVKLLDETSTAAATKAVNEKLATLGIDETTKKFTSFGGVDAAELAALGKKEKMASFIKAVFNRDMNTLGAFKSLQESSGSVGGFVVPEEFAAEVDRIVEDFGLVPKMARKFPMISDQLNVPRLSASVTVSYPGEATAGNASQPTFEQVVLTTKTLVGLTPMSNELLADANISVVDLLTELFAEAIAGMLDTQGLAGIGAPFTGILSDTGVTVYQPANSGGFSTFTGAATPDNTRNMIAQVKPWALQGAAFIMHRTVWSLIQQTKTSGSGEYFWSAANPQLSGSAVVGFPTAQAGTLWGYPVYLSDKMPTTTAVSTKFIIFGNLKNLYMGVRQEMGVAISQDATVGSDNLFAANMSAVRVVTRHALAVGLPAAFCVLKTAAS